MKVFSSNHHRRHQHSTIIPFPSLCMLTKPTIIGLLFLQASRWWDDHCILDFCLHHTFTTTMSIELPFLSSRFMMNAYYVVHILLVECTVYTLYYQQIYTDVRYIYREWSFHGLKLWIYMRKTSLRSSCLQFLSWNLRLTGRRRSRRKRLQMMWTELCWAARQKRFHLPVKTLLQFRRTV